MQPSQTALSFLFSPQDLTDAQLKVILGGKSSNNVEEMDRNQLLEEVESMSAMDIKAVFHREHWSWPSGLPEEQQEQTSLTRARPRKVGSAAGPSNATKKRSRQTSSSPSSPGPTSRQDTNYIQPSSSTSTSRQAKRPTAPKKQAKRPTAKKQISRSGKRPSQKRPSSMPQKSKPEDVHCLLQKMILWSADNPGDYVTKYVRADLAHESPLRMGQRQKNGKIQFSSYEMGIIDEARDFFQIFKTNKRQERYDRKKKVPRLPTNPWLCLTEQPNEVAAQEASSEQLAAAQSKLSRTHDHLNSGLATAQTNTEEFHRVALLGFEDRFCKAAAKYYTTATNSGIFTLQPRSSSVFEDKQILSICLETLLSFHPFQEEAAILRVLAISTVPPTGDSLFWANTPWPERLDNAKKALFQHHCKLDWTPTLINMISFLRCGIASFYWCGFSTLEHFVRFIEHTYPLWWPTWVLFLARTNPVIQSHLKASSPLSEAYTSLVTGVHRQYVDWLSTQEQAQLEPPSELLGEARKLVGKAATVFINHCRSKTLTETELSDNED